MKNYYYNPKTQDIMIFDTERNEIDVLEVLKGIRVITSSEIRSAWSGKSGSEDFNQEAPVKVYKKQLNKAIKWKCKNCGELGHSAKTCKQPPKVAPDDAVLPDKEITAIAQEERATEAV